MRRFVSRGDESNEATPHVGEIQILKQTSGDGSAASWKSGRWVAGWLAGPTYSFTDDENIQKKQ